MTTTILLAPSADLARQTLAAAPVALTVEAEYGAFVAEGAVYTAAHHQPAGSPHAGRHVTPDGRPSPCNDTGIPVVPTGTILVSHVDLDTFGGCLRALGKKGLFGVEYQSFWDLAEFIDVSGAHKIGASGASEQDIRRLNAFWAWSKTNTPRYPRDTVTDVTDIVLKANVSLTAILLGDEDYLVPGDAFRAADHALNTRTFNRVESSIIVRVAEVPADFCNHLYTTPSGEPARAVASYNKALGSVTISLADPVPGVSCRSLVQGLWGPEAGGHDGIAGSPRESDLGLAGLEAAVAALDEALSR